jgi:hypothetical protein
MRRLTYMGIGLVTMIWVVLAGCGGDDDDNNDANVTGTFRGTIQDSIAGTGTITVTLAQDDSDLIGTYQTTFADPRNNSAGSVEGEVQGNAVTLTATPSVTPLVPTACPFNVTAIVNGAQISGTYAAFNCTVAVSGSLTLTRQ